MPAQRQNNGWIVKILRNFVRKKKKNWKIYSWWLVLKKNEIYEIKQSPPKAPTDISDKNEKYVKIEHLRPDNGYENYGPEYLFVY